jgi:lysophospholipase L1-like esterase
VKRTLRTLLAVAMTAGALAATPPAPAQEVPTRIGFTWEMAPRFGVDRDGDGRVEIENTYAHVHSRGAPCSGPCPLQRFRVTLRATPDPALYGIPSGLVSYEWRIAGPGGMATHLRSHPELNLRLPEGLHSIDLRTEVRVLWGTVTLRRRGTIDVDDLLVAAIGDSYASGEGNPDAPLRGDTPALWADASDPAVEAEHALAHRSTVGWPAQLATALEVGDRHTSVTFVDLAASSARIGAGVLRPHPFLDLPAQLEQLEEAVGDRRIDVLLLQVGGNDIGFSQLIRELVDADPIFDPICYDTMIDNVRASVVDGRWDRTASLGYDPPFGIVCRPGGGERASRVGLVGLPGEIDALAVRLRSFDIDRVLIAEYPDPTGSGSGGELCEEIVGDATPPFGFHEVDEREQQWGRDQVVAPLNETIRSAAARHGWVAVTGVADSFLEGHGYCAPWPDYGYPAEFYDLPLLRRDPLRFPEGWYRPPGPYGAPLLLTRADVSWYRTASQSAALQGPAPRFLTSGTLHPNELGHAAIARLALALVGGD